MVPRRRHATLQSREFFILLVALQPKRRFSPHGVDSQRRNFSGSIAEVDVVLPKNLDYVLVSSDDGE
jgi:hypothetical protein